MRYIILIVFIVVKLNCNSQNIFWQETLHGGTCMAGIQSYYSNGYGYFSIHKPENSIIKKAFFIANNRGNPLPHAIILNGLNLMLDSTSVATSNFASNYPPPNCDLIGLGKTASTNIIDVSEFIDVQGENFEIYISPQEQQYCMDIYIQYFLWILYEDSTMPLTTACLILNEKDSSPVWDCDLKNLVPIDSINDVGYTFLSSGFTSVKDGSFVFVNNNNFGLCYGDDSNSLFTGGGTTGSFYYENNSLFGLGDDTSDDTANGRDALLNIKNIIPAGVDSLNLQFFHFTEIIDTSGIYGKFTNPIWALALAYTPYECEVLPINITSDTAICLGSSVTLTASGGTDYFWQSSMGSLGVLDSTSNSITVAPTTTTSYTVRIEADGFCPEVRPVQVVVHKIPKPVITSTTSTCGDAVGNIEVTLPYCFCDAFSINFNNLPAVIIDTALSPLNFNNLPTGVYPITITDNIGCAWSGNTFVEIPTLQ
jgi:hypothetical protein